MTTLLLDTHALLWGVSESERLSDEARGLMEDGANVLLASAACIWEVAVKMSIGKLAAPSGFPQRLVDDGYVLLPITPEHAWATHALPLHHRDPFDRLLVAQSQIDRLPIVSADPVLDQYGISRIW